MLDPSPISPLITEKPASSREYASRSKVSKAVGIAESESQADFRAADGQRFRLDGNRGEIQAAVNREIPRKGHGDAPFPSPIIREDQSSGDITDGLVLVLQVRDDGEEMGEIQLDRKGDRDLAAGLDPMGSGSGTWSLRYSASPMTTW